MPASESELFLDELNAICERTNKFDDIKTVSPLVCEFTEKIINSQLTKSSIDELEKEMAYDCKPLDEAVKNLAEKIWPACEDGIGYAEKTGIKNQAIADLISFNSRELNANNLCIQFCMLSRFIKWLWNDDPVKHRNFYRTSITFAG